MRSSLVAVLALSKLLQYRTESPSLLLRGLKQKQQQNSQAHGQGSSSQSQRTATSTSTTQSAPTRSPHATTPRTATVQSRLLTLLARLVLLICCAPFQASMAINVEY
ncbi:hypothetical protein DFJ58DRAFT_189852 [Suillus subalutaceus]|uniref:uncharacterized protein n=1 Tax=Suillus subalutaceus TaxID=48586 RepID=UPI001B880059|nr:uncharacterized protein DFJ58DRAFT_189852 [Suillus subalutaceus]KAG1836110.1 hypothetical protein DFJ58DRAFT_189852 [Suillus subalutaceus]